MKWWQQAAFPSKSYWDICGSQSIKLSDILVLLMTSNPN
jgi:hypothetical protein